MARPEGTKNLTPEELWKLFLEYIGSLETIEVPVVHVKLGTTHLKIKEPMTMEGFGCFSSGMGFTIHHYVDNPKNAYDDYRGIVTRIKETIFKNNFSRAAAGMYKENLIAKQLGLKEKIEQTNIEQPLFPETKKEDEAK